MHKCKLIFNSVSFLLIGRFFLVDAAIDNSIIISGGFENNKTLQDLPTRKSEILGKFVCRIPPLPFVTQGHSMVMTNNKEPMVIGGTIDANVPTKVCYILKNGQWTIHSVLPEFRIYSSAITMPQGIYVFGGRKIPFPNPVVIHKTSFDTSNFLPNGSTEWQDGPKLTFPGNHCGHAVAISDDEILFTGGTGLNVLRLMKYKISTNKWTHSLLNKKRWHHSSAVYGDYVIICGGTDFTHTTLDSTEIYCISNGTLRLAGNLNFARRGHGMGIINVNGESKLIAFGGRGFFNNIVTYLSSVEEWNTETESWTVSNLTLSEPRWSFSYCHNFKKN